MKVLQCLKLLDPNAFLTRTLEMTSCICYVLPNHVNMLLILFCCSNICSVQFYLNIYIFNLNCQLFH